MTEPGLAAAVPEDAARDGVFRQVKLVVWDLDDTLWAGTLSEGAVRVDERRALVVRTLNRRGIVNAICSNNDERAARLRLVEAGLLDEFVFTRIGWTPKGPRVAQLIEDAQLRPENVLFIDDLATNRREVRHFVPDIQTAGPEITEHLLSLPELTGKDDPGLTRLEQYRVLERKLADRQEAAGSNESFLRSCDIRVGLFEDTTREGDRLFELATRTHQLNFTKRRPSRHEFDAMLADHRFETGYVRIRDRYGDYGICGFYSVDREEDVLVDFLFSCRILHMGVEQWVYGALGRPAITVVGEVASSLDGPVDWITSDPTAFADVGTAAGERAGDHRSGARAVRVLMIGGCDLTTTAEYLGGEITTDFAHTGPTGAFIHVGHTELLRQSASGVAPEALALVDRIPFLDRSVYSSPAVVDPDYDLLVYSVLTDYTQGLYRHRHLGLVVPWYQCHVDVTREAVWPWVLRRYEREGVDRRFLSWFADEFEWLGGISPEQFSTNLRWLAASVPPDARIVFLNGAEIPLYNPKEPERHLRHRVMNEALDRTVAELENADVCDMRRLVEGPADLVDNLRHYQRQVYLRMAEEIRALATDELSVTRIPLGTRAARSVYRFGGRQKLQLRRWRKRLRRSR
jgi:FkbH-like protein